MNGSFARILAGYLTLGRILKKLGQFEDLSHKSLILLLLQQCWCLSKGSMLPHRPSCIEVDNKVPVNQSESRYARN